MSGSTPVSSLISPPEAASGRLPPDGGAPLADGLSPIRGGPRIEPAVSQSPAARAWRRFRRNRLGFVSLVIFGTLVVLSLFAEILSNDKPLVVRYHGNFYFPIVQDYPETTFGGDFPTSTDFLDPVIRAKITQDGNWALYPPNPYGANTLSYYAKYPFPSPPSPDNVL